MRKSELVAGREKDYRFTRALIEVGLVDAETLVTRAELLPGIPAIKRRVIAWLSAFQGSTEDPGRV